MKNHEVLIDIQDVSKTYARSRAKALDHCSLQIPRNHFCTITGKSGCGKTTLLNCISGLKRVDEGSIKINGKEITDLSEKDLCLLRQDQVGIIFQFFNLLEEQTVMENILLPIKIAKKQPDMAYVERILEVLDLKDLKDRFPSELSGGQQQRVAAARALAAKPQIILADEPTGNLDVKTSRQLMGFLKECQKIFAQTIVMVTHDLDLAKQGDILFYMEDGKILYSSKDSGKEGVGL